MQIAKKPTIRMYDELAYLFKPKVTHGVLYKELIGFKMGGIPYVLFFQIKRKQNLQFRILINTSPHKKKIQSCLGIFWERSEMDNVDILLVS